MTNEVWRIVVRVQLNRVEQTTMGNQRVEKIMTTQVTEGFGEGQTPRDACERAFENGIQSYIEGLSSLVQATGDEQRAVAEN